MNLSLENQHEQKSKDNNAQVKEQKLQERLEAKFKPKPFSERWKWVRLAALLVSYTTNSFSLITGSAAFTYFVYLQFHAVASPILVLSIGALLGIILGTCLELLKRGTSSNFFKAGFAENTWRWQNIIGLLFLTGISIGLSFWMSIQIPSILQPTSNLKVEPQLESIAAIDQRYEQMISEKQNAIQELKKKKVSHWRYNKLENAVTELQQAQLEERKAAQERNEKKRLQAMDDTRLLQLKQDELNMNHGSILGYVTILCELFFLLAMCYLEHYDWRSLLERMSFKREKASTTEDPPNQENETNEPNQVPEEVQEEIAHQRTIIQGFRKFSNDVETTPNYPIQEPPLEEQKTPTMNTTPDKLKQPVITGKKQAETALVLGYVTHKNERTGELEQLNEKQISARVRTYGQRVNEIIHKIEKDPTQDNYDTLHRRLVKMKYWSQKLGELYQNRSKSA